ncbi:hypothetical protein OKW96_16150 [Sphingobacterium sp. KU25419]|nr:hypothetical protein OKW96_16150 [Sphingobacterium sp. KU25419]
MKIINIAVLAQRKSFKTASSYLPATQLGIPAGISYAPSPNYFDDMIFSLSEDLTGNVWFATMDHGACRFDGKVFSNVAAKNGFQSRDATAIVEDRKGYYFSNFRH